MITLLTITAIFSIINTFIFLFILGLALIVRGENKENLTKLKENNEERKKEVREKLKNIINLTTNK